MFGNLEQLPKFGGVEDVSSTLQKYIKVILKTDQNQCTVYTDLNYVWEEFLKEIGQMFPEENLENLHKYWIDYENDKVDILDEKTYKIFLKMGNNNRKIYIENVIKSTAAYTTTTGATATSPEAESAEAKTTSDLEGSDIHYRVICDGCQKEPIVGFRYKCVQCPDYDLCETCEHSKKHKHHVMFRFPTSLRNIPFNRHFLKKMKKGCFIYPEADGEEETTPRRYHHHVGSNHGHRRCRNNIFSSLYTMMQDMAEGTEGPTEDDGDDNGKAEDSAENKKKEKQDAKKYSKGRDEWKSRRSYSHEIPPITIPPIDPSYLKTGVEILGNFSEMFSKMLNPGNITLDIQVDTDNNNTEPSAAPATSAATTNKKSTEEFKEGNNEKKETTKSPTPSREEKTENDDRENSRESSVNQNFSSGRKQSSEQEKEEFDWTMINAPPSSSSGIAEATGRKASIASTTSSGSGGATRKSPQSNGNSKDASPLPDYAKLSKELREHIQNEEMKAAATVVVETMPSSPSAPLLPPPPPATTTTKEEEPAHIETRAKIVYHKNRRIDDAVHAMMAMGFSNDSNWLTCLLESVDGDICQALDLLKPVK